MTIVHLTGSRGSGRRCLVVKSPAAKGTKNGGVSPPPGHKKIGGVSPAVSCRFETGKTYQVTMVAKVTPLPLTSRVPVVVLPVTKSN